MSERNLFVSAYLLALAAFALGTGLALLWGGAPPAWLLTLVLALILAVALWFGFTGAWPRLVPWLKCRPIQGAALVCGGVAMIFMPVTWVAAGAAIAIGTHLVWRSACELGGHDREVIEVRAVVRDAVPATRGSHDGAPANGRPAAEHDRRRDIHTDRR
jgi:hypothetical protein